MEGFSIKAGQDWKDMHSFESVYQTTINMAEKTTWAIIGNLYELKVGFRRDFHKNT